MFGWNKKVDRAVWAEILYQKTIAHPERESDEKLSQLTTFMLEQHHRIIMESIQIVLETKYAETRQSRISLIQKHHREMLKLKPFCNRKQIATILEAEKPMRQASLL